MDKISIDSSEMLRLMASTTEFEIWHAFRHEMHGTLDEIQGCAHVLDKIFAKQGDQRKSPQAELVKRIVDAATRANHLLRNRSSFALGAARTDAQIASCSIQHIVEEALSAVDYALNRNGISVEIDRTHQPFMVEAVESQLIVAFLNVFLNAIVCLDCI